MIKEIKYNGYTTSPSDYECPDGDLAASVGLAHDDNGLCPVQDPGAVNLSIESGYKLVFIHHTSSGINYIFQSSTFSFLYLHEGETTSGSVKNMYGDVSDVYEVNAVGNTLTILTNIGVWYFLWNGSGYTDLGTHLPECNLSFGLQAEVKQSESFDITFTPINEGNIYDDLSEENTEKVTTQVLAKVNKFIKDNSVSNGKFVYPFFVRYAYRLYDGSLTMHSAPILMIATSGLAPQCFLESFTKDGGKYKSAKARVFAAFHQLYVELQGTLSFGNWGDIIKSVDVFVSKPIYTYDQNGSCKRFIEQSGDGSYSICKHINRQQGYDSYYSKKTYNKLYADTFNNGEAYPGHRVDLPKRSDEVISEEISNCSLFYLLQSINISNIKYGFSRLLEIDGDYLQSLVAREVMTDDYDSHDLLIPKTSYTYNGRLNLTGITKTLFDGFPAASLFNYTTDATSNTYYVYVFIKQDGNDIIVCSDYSYLGQDRSFSYMYYPNPKAYKAVIRFGSYYYEVPLHSHTSLNGAYYFGGFFGELESCGSVSSTSSTVNVLNKIYTSEINNPFLFPVTGINTIGVSEIIGLSSNAVSISQGQFGQFPMYAFTSEGVWALEVSTNGGFSSTQPVSRDVCLSKNSITQLDRAVIFATDRGIILLSGSNSQCITENIDNEFVFKFSDLGLPGGVLPTSATDVVNFKTFVCNCRMIYDYIHQRIIVYNNSYSYAYILSLKKKLWGVVNISIDSHVNSYPNAYAILSNGNLVDFSTYSSTYSASSSVLVTRPLKLDLLNIFKTIDSVIVRGGFASGNVKSILMGSNDLSKWIPVWSSTTHIMRGFRGTPYKFYRIVLICTLAKDEYISGCTIQYTPRITNQPR